MAGNYWILQNSADKSVAAASTKTLLQLQSSDAHVRQRMNKVTISCRGGASGDAFVLVEVLRQTTAGTGGNSVSASKTNPSYSENLHITGQEGLWATTEPTAGVILESKYISPVNGSYTFTVPREVQGSGYIGVRVTTQSGVATVSCRCQMEGEE